MILPDNFYIHQQRGYNLGNFIMCTHAIDMLYELTKRPVKVLFDCDWVAQYFEGAYQIEPITHTTGLIRLFGTSLINTVIYDGLFIHNMILDKYKIPAVPMSPAFTGSHGTNNQGNPIVVISGNGSKASIEELKTIPDNVYQSIIEKCEALGQKVSLVGSTRDVQARLKRYHGYSDIIIDDPVAISQEIRNAKVVISNDTGLYHYSSAMRKTQFVLWKDTRLTKNFNPHSAAYTTISTNPWLEEFNDWIGKQV